MTSPQTPDLSSCAREPIHIPGAIQPHGLLLALDDALTVTHASANWAGITGTQPAALLGRSLDRLLAPGDVDTLRRVLQLPDLRVANPLLLRAVPGAAAGFQGIVHRSTSGVVILELEPSGEGGIAFLSFYHTARRSLLQLQEAATLGELMRRAAAHVQALTGFGKVMVYQFDEAWNGTVLAEVSAPGWDPYLDLRFPASDIPEQARRLYTVNWLRLIVDVDYEPVPLLAAPGHATPLDLSFSVLRSVSPVHLEYLRNMRVGASLSISIMKDGKLWGLIACHHDKPSFVDYQVRAACEFLGQMLSYQISAVEGRADFAARQTLRAVQARIVTGLAESGEDLAAGLAREAEPLLGLVRATGFAAVLQSGVVRLGDAPSEDEVRRLVAWLDERITTDAYATDRLAEVAPEGPAPTRTASGLLAIRLARSPRGYLLWFRPEVAQTVTWAGNPEKPVTAEPGLPDRLHPRKSFAQWVETVRGRSAPWTQPEIDAALELRTQVLAGELRRVNHDLAESNEELDAFASIAAHDLKEPVRGIRTYAGFIEEDDPDGLSAESKRRLAQIKELAGTSERLLDSLFQVSRVGRVALAVEPTDLGALVQSVLTRLAPLLEEKRVEVVVQPGLPTVTCDRVRVAELFHNLISNAAKYNDKPSPRIEIGAEGPVFHVKDNGIGIPERHLQTVFQMFRRLHGRDRYGGGTGAGLAIAKKIVARHEGEIWVESQEGEGTTFFFTLSPRGEA